jgi:hypothetical protein
LCAFPKAYSLLDEYIQFLKELLELRAGDGPICTVEMQLTSGPPRVELQTDLKASDRETITAEIKSKFLEYIKLPHAHLEPTFDAYREWEKENMKEAAYDQYVWWLKGEGGYDQAVLEWQKREPHEAKLASTGNSLAAFEDYVAFENAESSENSPHKFEIIGSLWERCLEANCLDPGAWEKYLDHLVMGLWCWAVHRVGR